METMFVELNTATDSVVCKAGWVFFYELRLVAVVGAATVAESGVSA